jgi:hypothetical protein
MPSSTVFSPTDWQARNVTELRSIWEELRPDSAAPGTERRFRGRVLTAEEAGDVFERWVLEAFRLSGASGHYSYSVPLKPEGGPAREQIDGLLLDNWQAFMLESKFWTNKVDLGPISLLADLVELRPLGTLGLFFSVFGYTPAALDSVELRHPIRVLLFDRVDLTWAIGQKRFRGRMAEMVNRKWMLAVKYGRAAMPVTEPLDLFP